MRKTRKANPNSVDISGTSYYGHVDSVQPQPWLRAILSHVSAEKPVVTFESTSRCSPRSNEFDGYDDGPPGADADAR